MNDKNEVLVEETKESCCAPTCCTDGSKNQTQQEINKSDEELKEIVKEKYSEVISGDLSFKSSCCSSEKELTSFALDYSKLEGYNKDADYALGCGIPTDLIDIKEGYTVLDLGSGAGNDVFVARQLVGETGYVIGVDMTEAMIEKANINKSKVGYSNVDFRLGEIEKLPIDNNSVDVVISNCVLNLVPDKVKSFAEIFRVIKPGGEFSISDIVLEKELAPALKNVAELYAGCVSGAILKDEYLEIIKDSGFVDIEVKKSEEKKFTSPILQNSMSKEEFEALKEKEASVYSITVYAKKPY